MTTDNHTYRPVDVPVRGGSLRVGVWEPKTVGDESSGPPTIVAVHGITASHRSFVAVVDRFPGYRVVAPDLRGRGRSNGLPGPFGMIQHADDVVAALDFLGVGRAVVLGHSMGGFVSVVFAHRYPERLQALVLIDGGVPLAIPDGVDPQAFATAFLSSVSARLTMAFPDHEAYRAYYRAHPAFAEVWNEAVVDYVDYDLVGEPPELRPATSVEAMTADATDQTSGPALAAALEQLPSPTIFLRAPRGFLNDEPGLFPPAWLRQWQEKLPALDVREVVGVNHYTILFTPAGIAAIAAAVHDSQSPRAVHCG